MVAKVAVAAIMIEITITEETIEEIEITEAHPIDTIDEEPVIAEMEVEEGEAA